MNSIENLNNLRRDMELFLFTIEILNYRNTNILPIDNYDFIKKRMLNYKKQMSIIKTRYRKLVIDDEIEIHTNYSCLESINDTISMHLEFISKIIDKIDY